MSNSPLQEFEPLDVLVGVVAARVGQRPHDIAVCVVDGVWSGQVRISGGGENATYWERSRSKEARSSRQSRSPTQFGEFNVFADDFARPETSAWNEPSPRDRLRDELSSGGSLLVESKSAIGYLETLGLVPLGTYDALTKPSQNERRPEFKPGPRPIPGLKQHLFIYLLDNGRPETKEALIDEARAFCAQRGGGRDARSTLLPYVNDALRDYEEHLATRLEG